MLNELLRVLWDPAQNGRRVLLRLSLMLAGVALLWTVVILGVACGFGALDIWLRPVLGPAAALAITAALGILTATLVLLWLRRGARRSERRSSMPPLRAQLQLIDRFPLESAAVAAAAGVLLSRVDGATLARLAFDQLRSSTSDYDR